VVPNLLDLAAPLENIA